MKGSVLFHQIGGIFVFVLFFVGVWGREGLVKLWSDIGRLDYVVIVRGLKESWKERAVWFGLDV